ncbi:porin family protein [Pontibacter pamirensis]|uniref:porin family protein n=1 Tax=Pontibacter pamirensis TaxID=2562824 RepID=UPI001389EB85|nr:porin family protein [Pontibacter pamirensis]
MKNKYLLTVAAALGFTFAAEAQTVSVGPRLGATFSTMNYSGEDAEDYNEAVKSVAGMQIGGVANIMINELFSIQPELLYVQKGLKMEEDGATYKQKLNYLEVPVLAKVSFGAEQLQGFVTAGPSVGYWLSGKERMEYDGEKESDDYEFGDEDNRTELGANFGVGVAYKVGAGAVNFDVRYGFGLSSLYETSEGDDSKVKNRVLGVSLAYLFSL